MQDRIKRTLAVSTLLLPFVFANGSYADGKSKGKKPTSAKSSAKSSSKKAPELKTEFEAKLRPTLTSLEPKARGEAEFEAKTDKQEFEVKVKVPYPSTPLGIIDEASAVAALLQIQLSHPPATLGGLPTPYASCALELAEIEIEFEDGVAVEGHAVYKAGVEAKSKLGVVELKEKRGACDVDLVAAGAQAGVPAVQNGDLASVSIGAVPVELLTGTFSADGHDDD